MYSNCKEENKVQFTNLPTSKTKRHYEILEAVF